MSRTALRLELDAEPDYLDAIIAELVDVAAIAVDRADGTLELASAGGGPPAAEARGHAERRQVTFLLGDVQSSTELSTRLDPEDLRDLMLQYQSLADTAIRRFGGHISQWIGDGVVAYFGYPEAGDGLVEGGEGVRTAARVAPGVEALQQSLILRQRRRLEMLSETPFVVDGLRQLDQEESAHSFDRRSSVADQRGSGTRAR